MIVEEKENSLFTRIRVLLFIFSNKFEKFGHFNPRATSKCLSVRLAYLLLLKRFNGQVIILIYWLLSLAASPRPRTMITPHTAGKLFVNLL